MARGKLNIPDDEFTVRRYVHETREKKETVDKNVIQYIECEKIECDEDNEKIYGDDTYESVDFLANEIKENGFKGVIMAYPIDDMKYRIESGHRRYKAAVQAGLSKVPVIITEKPKSESERQIRLIAMNLHTRNNIKPLTMTRVIDTLLAAHKTLLEQKGESSDIGKLQELVAQDVELSTKTVEKYRQLNKLIPELKELADAGISWSALTSAASLTEEKQKHVYEKISDEIKRVGIDMVPRVWITNLCNSIKASDDKTAYVPPQKTGVIRRRDMAKVIARCTKDLKEVLLNDSIIKEKDRDTVIADLTELKKSIEEKLEELNSNL